MKLILGKLTIIIFLCALGANFYHNNNITISNQSENDTIGSGWITAPPMPEARWGGGSAFLSRGAAPNDTGFIYYIAGVQGFTSSKVQRYNLRTNVWDTVSPLPAKLLYFSAVTAGGKIYVIGGWLGFYNAVNTVYIYTPSADTWTTGAAIPVRTGGYAAGVYRDSLIYIIGGHNGGSSLNTVQVYNIHSNTWSTATSKPGTPVFALRGAIYNNKIVIAGGCIQSPAATIGDSYTGTIDPSNPSQIVWTANPPYPLGKIGRHASGSAFNNDAGFPYVFFTGGDTAALGNPSTGLRRTYGFNVNTSQWEECFPKITRVHSIDNFVSVKYNDTLFMVLLGGVDSTVIVGKNEWLRLGPSHITGIQNTTGEIPGQYSLSQNYPNPFNPQTVISFSLPEEGIARIKIFDISGKEVMLLLEEYVQAGTYSVSFNGTGLAGGVYFYSMTAGSYTSTRKMILIK